MTFNTIALKYAFFCKQKIDIESPTILDIGAQTPTFNINSFEKYISNLEVINEVQKNAIEEIKSKKSFTAKEAYVAMGYKKYEIIDINGAYDSYKFDLNQDIESSYNFKNQYDVVINNGTGEHVFNQFSLYKNIHNLTKEGGLMLNILPFLGWTNHGFYNYHPIFFADLAASNNYEFIRMTFANRDGNEIFLQNMDNHKLLYDQIKPHRPPTTLNKLVEASFEKLGKNIFIVSVYKKLSNNEFKTPLQGKYLDDIKDFDTKYNSQKQGSSIAEGQISDNNKRKIEI